MATQLDTRGEDFGLWRVDSDAYGNSRYVVHYLAIPFEDDEDQPFYVNQNNHIERAKDALKGSKYRAKWFGGGIVFQAYAGDPIMHVKAAIRSAETGQEFVDAYKAVRDEYIKAMA
jgi:hypothetical protein